MGIRLIRHTYRLGKSRAVTLPTHWVSFYGDRISRVVITGDKFLIVAPEAMADEACRLADDIEHRTVIESEVKTCP